MPPSVCRKLSAKIIQNHQTHNLKKALSTKGSKGKDFSKYKKSQLIKMIIELGLPVVMLILLAIIFFASGLYESLSQLISMY